jgi:hypothetical protein
MILTAKAEKINNNHNAQKRVITQIDGLTRFLLCQSQIFKLIEVEGFNF